MEACGKQVAEAIVSSKLPGAQIHLTGELGAGKTTFARGFIQAMGYEGHVKSPTYTLIEPYETPYVMIYHLDLYRLSNPEELEFLAYRDLCQENSICLIEWPEQGGKMLCTADITINIVFIGDKREVGMTSVSSVGNRLLQCL